MQVKSSYSFNAPVERVWETMLDPDTIAHCIPGCKTLTPLGDDKYEATITVGVGAITGSYRAKITLADQVPQSSYRLKVEADGSAGFIRGEASISMEGQGQKTLVTVDGEAQVGGTIARVGQRLLGTVNKRMMDNFFSCLQKAVTS